MANFRETRETRQERDERDEREGAEVNSYLAGDVRCGEARVAQYFYNELRVNGHLPREKRERRETR